MSLICTERIEKIKNQINRLSRKIKNREEEIERNRDFWNKSINQRMKRRLWQKIRNNIDERIERLEDEINDIQGEIETLREKQYYYIDMRNAILKKKND